MPFSDLSLLGAAACGVILCFALPWTLVEPWLGLVDLAALVCGCWCMERGERA